jgi:hypothetical protein
MAADAGRTQSQDPADMFEGKNVLHVRFEKPSRSVAKPSIIAAPVLFVFQKRIFQNRKHKFSLRLDIARMQQSLAIGSLLLDHPQVVGPHCCPWLVLGTYV